MPSARQTADITLRFAKSSVVLHVGFLKVPIVNNHPELNIARTKNFASPGIMTVLVARRGAGFDQPYVEATTEDAKDRVYVGNNDFNDPQHHTATIDRSLDSGTIPPPAGFKKSRLETRSTLPQEGPEIRPAISSDGKTIYGIFYRWTKFEENRINATVDVVVVRDDNAGDSALPFTSLKDMGDNSSGVRVVTDRPLQWRNQTFLGQDRIGGDPAIAIDPRDSKSVYILWGDFVNNHYTLHVRHSSDSGVTCGDDLRTIPDAKNPGLAVND